MKAFPQSQLRETDPVDTFEHGGMDLLHYFAIHATDADVKYYQQVLANKRKLANISSISRVDARYAFAKDMMEGGNA